MMTSTPSSVIMKWPNLLPIIAIVLLTPGIHVQAQAGAPPMTNSSQKQRQFPSGFGSGPGGNPGPGQGPGPGQMPNQQALLQMAAGMPALQQLLLQQGMMGGAGGGGGGGPPTMNAAMMNLLQSKMASANPAQQQQMLALLAQISAGGGQPTMAQLQQLNNLLEPPKLDCETLDKDSWCKKDCSTAPNADWVKYCEAAQSECCGLPIWAWVLIIFAILLVVGIIIGVVVYFVMKKKQGRGQGQPGGVPQGQAYSQSPSQMYAVQGQGPPAPSYHTGMGAPPQ